MAFQAIALQMGVAWGLGMLNRAMAGRPPRPPKPRPDDADFPLTKIGTPIPIVYGTMRIDNPVLVWADLFTQTLIPAYGIYRYGASCMFVLGVGPQKAQPGTGIPWWSDPVLRKIWVAEKPAAMPIVGGVLTHGNSVAVDIDLGSDGNGGRFKGYLEFFDGRADQVITTYPSVDTSLMKRVDKAFLASAQVDRSLVPGYRNQMLLACLCDTYTVGSDATFGESADFPAIAVEVSVTDPDAVDALFANPAWVLYDLVCAQIYKLGYDSSKVGIASFQTAAATLITEGHGCSVLLDAEEDIEQIVNALVAQTDGVIDEDPSTGLIEYRLVRAADALGTLPELTIDNTIGRPRITQTGWLENANHIDVTFTNRAKQYKPDSIPSKRLSNAINQSYRHRPRTVSYPYCMTATLAGKLAARDAAVLCRPLMTCSAVVNREFYALRRGQCVKANWPQYGVTDKIFRVLDIDRGQLADDNIRLTLIEDVFDNTSGAVVPEEGTVSVVDQLPIRRRLLDEAPLWLTKLAVFEGSISDSSTPRVLMSGRFETEQDPAVGYAGNTRLAGTTDFTADVPLQIFPTTATVATVYAYYSDPYDVTGLVIEDVSGRLAATFASNPASFTRSPVDGANLIRINGEMMAFESVTDLGGGQYRLNGMWRGLHDTTADDHAVGDVVYWLNASSVGTRAWAAAQQIDGKSDPVLGDPLDSAIDQLTMAGDGAEFSTVAGRAGRPLRGADLRADALEYVTGTTGSTGYKRIDDYDGEIDLVWRQRNNSPTTVIRGDDTTSYPVAGFSTWGIYGRKVGATAVALSSAVYASVAKTGVLLGKVGHGEIDLLLRTLNSFFGPSWQDARVRVSAHRARNLLGNGGAHSGVLSPWTETQGTMQISTGITSLERTTTAKWFRALTGVVV